LTHVYIRNDFGSNKQNALTIARFSREIFSIYKDDEKPILFINILHLNKESESEKAKSQFHLQT